MQADGRLASLASLNNKGWTDLVIFQLLLSVFCVQLPVKQIQKCAALARLQHYFSVCCHQSAVRPQHYLTVCISTSNSQSTVNNLKLQGKLLKLRNKCRGAGV